MYQITYRVKQRETANLFKEIKNILIINKLYVTPVNFFFCILFLLHLENMLSNINSNLVSQEFWNIPAQRTQIMSNLIEMLL